MSELHEDESRGAEALARVGTTLRGKWRLDALLGLGGMAAVYSATHRNGMRGAVKVLDHALSRLESMRDRFLREGYLANKVDHPCAVRVLDDDVAEDGSAFLVMELLRGQTLEELAQARGGSLPPEDVLAFMAQVLDALDVAHRAGIVHRDIKPDNLFVTDQGLMKVLDFGLARMLEAERTTTSTQSGISMGTPAFMSPEQARGRWDLVDARSDVWGIAATMFTSLSGRMVHEGHLTAAEMIAATFTQHAPSLATVLPDARPELVAVVDGGLKLERDLRWGSAASMLAAVRVAYHAITGSEVPPPPSVPPVSGDSRRVSRPSEAQLSFSPTWSQRPRLYSDVSPTVPPPAPARKRRWLVAAAAVVLIVGGAATAAHQRATASSLVRPPASPHDEPSAPPAAVAGDPPAARTTQTATAIVESPVAPVTAMSKAKANDRPTKPDHPKTSSSSVPSASAPAVNLFDRRY